MGAFLGLRTGLREYAVGKPQTLLTIDESVMEVRPYMVAGVVREVSFNDAFIRSLMDVQEKLHARSIDYHEGKQEDLKIDICVRNVLSAIRGDMPNAN
jgi:phenylalanyl-tRNA synthetase beta subunit